MNRYQKNRKRRGVLGSITGSVPTRNDAKGSLIETAKDLGIGVIGGGIAGAAIGRGSLLIGLLATFAGHYTDKRLLQAFGFGMMAANGFQTKTAAVNGLEGLSGVKERIMAFKESFSEKLFLDKILNKAPAISGLGEVQYFSYTDPNGTRELDLSALNAIERQLQQSAQDFQVRGMEGYFDDSEMESGGII